MQVWPGRSYNTVPIGSAGLQCRSAAFVEDDTPENTHNTTCQKTDKMRKSFLEQKFELAWHIARSKALQKQIFKVFIAGFRGLPKKSEKMEKRQKCTVLRQPWFYPFQLLLRTRVLETVSSSVFHAEDGSESCFVIDWNVSEMAHAYVLGTMDWSRQWFSQKPLITGQNRLHQRLQHEKLS